MLNFHKLSEGDKKKFGPFFSNDFKDVVELETDSDKEYMFMHYGDDYVWFETVIKLARWMDTENANTTVESFYNVFQVIVGGQPRVIFISHQDDNTAIVEKDGFWMEDERLNASAINIYYSKAFDMAMQSNYPKPHSKNCILRKPVGAKDCNPQWVFGNEESQIWVDATTGEVRDSNPAF